MHRVFNHWPATIAGREVVPNVPDLFGNRGARSVEADAAQRQRESPVILHSRVSRKNNGTLGTASLPGNRDGRETPHWYDL